jgi:hypothetical protein
VELDATMVSPGLLFHKALAVNDLDVIVFAEEPDLIHIVKFIVFSILNNIICTMFSFYY